MAHKTPQKNRRKYDAAFKQEVIQMIANGRSVPEVARSLGIGDPGTEDGSLLKELVVKLLAPAD